MSRRYRDFPYTLFFYHPQHTHIHTIPCQMPILLQVVTYTDTLLSKVHSLLRALPSCHTPYGFGQMCNDILHPEILVDCNGEQGHALLSVQDLLLISSNSLCPSDSLGSGPPSSCLSLGITDILLWPRPLGTRWEPALHPPATDKGRKAPWPL